VKTTILCCCVSRFGKPEPRCWLCLGKGEVDFEDDTATEADGCSCPQSVRDTGSHSTACPLFALPCAEAA
jgi:hypothetical protein